MKLKNKTKRQILEEVKIRADRNQRIKTACRDLCLHNGVDPDIIICRMMPAYVSYPIPTFIVPDPQMTMPAWRLYEEVIIQALLILEATQNA